MTASDTATSTDSMRPRPHASVETAFLPPDVVLFDDRHGEIHHLNASASAVWLMIDGELTVDDVADELSEIFSVPTDQIRPDVDTAIDDFRSRGLLDGSARADDPGSDRSAVADVEPSGADPSGDEVSDGESDVSPRLEIVGRPPDT
jgi:hypothetical protein